MKPEDSGSDIASRSRQVVLIVAGVLGGLVIDYAVVVRQSV